MNSARVELPGQLGMGRTELPTIDGATGLEVGHIAVQDAHQLGGGVERTHDLRIAAVGVARLICRRVELWLGHAAVVSSNGAVA